MLLLRTGLDISQVFCPVIRVSELLPLIQTRYQCAVVRSCTDHLTQQLADLLPGIAITEGGVIPATLVYLGGFYKSTELATRLAWFWGVQVTLNFLASSFQVIHQTSPLIDDCQRGQWSDSQWTSSTTRCGRPRRMEMVIHRRRHYHDCIFRSHLVRVASSSLTHNFTESVIYP